MLGEVVSVAVEAVENAVAKVWLGMFNLWQQLWFLLVMTAYTAFIVKDHPILLLIPVVQFFCDFLVYKYRAIGQYVKSTVALKTSDSWKDLLINTCDVRWNMHSTPSYDSIQSYGTHSRAFLIYISSLFSLQVYGHIV